MNKWTPEGQEKLDELVNKTLKEATLIIGDEKEAIAILATCFSTEVFRIRLERVQELIKRLPEEEIFKQTPGCDCEYCKPKKEAIN